MDVTPVSAMLGLVAETGTAFALLSDLAEVFADGTNALTEALVSDLGCPAERPAVGAPLGGFDVGGTDAWWHRAASLLDSRSGRTCPGSAGARLLRYAAGAFVHVYKHRAA
jgi:hypothetical protein